jgi:hypothetical protein
MPDRIVYRPGQKRRPLRKRKPAPEITPPRIVTAYSPAKLAKVRRWQRIVAAQSGAEPEQS